MYFLRDNNENWFVLQRPYGTNKKKQKESVISISFQIDSKENHNNNTTYSQPKTVRAVLDVVSTPNNVQVTLFQLETGFLFSFPMETLHAFLIRRKKKKK